MFVSLSPFVEQKLKFFQQMPITSHGFFLTLLFRGGIAIGNFSTVNDAVKYKKGGFVFFQGEEARHFYLVKWERCGLPRRSLQTKP